MTGIKNTPTKRTERQPADSHTSSDTSPRTDTNPNTPGRLGAGARGRPREPTDRRSSEYRSKNTTNRSPVSIEQADDTEGVSIEGASRRSVLTGLGAGSLALATGGVGNAVGESAEQTDGSPVEWTFEVDEDFVESSPTVVDGVAYFADGRFGDDAGTIYAVDIETQDIVWSESVPEQIRKAPHVVGEYVYTGGASGGVYANNIDSGEEEWFEQTGGPIESSPTRLDDLVYVPSEDGFLYALDAETGDLEWEYEVGYPVATAPTIVDGIVYVADNPRESGIEGWVHAVDAETGDEEWTFESADLWFNSSPTVADGTVFIGNDDGTVYALDADSGGTEWTFTDPQEQVISATTYHDGVVYVGTDQDGPDTTDLPAVLYAIDAGTGDEIWSFSIGPEEGDWRFHSSPTVAGETVFIGSQNGTVYGIDINSGEDVWDFETGAAVWSSPTVVDGTLYVGSDDGNLYALDVPVEGSSLGTRVNLGTLGHHHRWTGFSDPEPEMGTVTGTVTDGDDDSAIGGATVELRSDGVVVSSTESDADGEYSLAAMPGTYTLSVAAFGYESHERDVTIEDDEETVENVQLTPLETVTVAGTVTDPADDGRDGATVEFFHECALIDSATTDPDGDYTIELVPATYRAVVVSPEGDGYLTHNEAVDVETSMTYDIQLTEGPPPLPGYEKPPTQAITDDEYYENVTGDGHFDIEDVQVFFEHRSADEVTQHAQFYDFAGLDEDTVSIFDVQGLFKRL